MGSIGVRRVLAVACLLLACSSSPKRQQDAAPGVEDAATDEKSDGMPVLDPDVVALRRDAPGEGGPFCQSTARPAYDAGVVPYPLDWQSAQSMSSWCALYLDSRTELCLAQTSDGYDVAAIAYVVGGEMGIVDQIYFLYDPVTGELVAKLYAELPSSAVTCAFGAPDGPANPAFDPYICYGGDPLRPVCAPAQDAGSGR